MIGNGNQSAILSYTLIDPSPVGNFFSSSHLIGIAGLRNRHLEDRSLGAVWTGFGHSDQTVRSLASQLLSAFAGETANAKFEETP